MSETAFVLKKILTPLILPPTGLLLCAVLGLLLLNRWPRMGKLLAWAGLVLLLTLSLPFTASRLLDAVVMESGLGTDAARTAQAIVILGGGTKPAPEYGGSTLSAAALLKASGIHTVLLVTHDLHQRRALREFSAAGIKAIAAPVTTAGRSGRAMNIAEQMPNAGALGLSSQALHEIIGIAILAPRTAEVR